MTTMLAAAAQGATETREVFESFETWQKALFYALSAVSTGIFLLGLGRRVRKYARGRREHRFDRPLHRLASALGTVYSQATVRRGNTRVGLFHGAVLWGFTALFVGTVILAVDVEFVRLFLGEEHSFFDGPFYLAYSVLLDLLGLAFVLGLVALALRRRSRPAELDYERAEQPPQGYSRHEFSRGDWFFVGALFVLGVTGFLGEGLRIRANGFPDHEVWSPVGWVVARAVEGAGVGAGAASDLQFANWWLHALLALAFVAYIPFSKAMHMVVDFANLAFRDERAARRLPPALPLTVVPGGNGAAAPAQPGYERLGDFTWKELLNLDSCTKCGRCHVACPARAAGAPLSPRDLILDLRQWADGQQGIRTVFDWEQRPDCTGPLAASAMPAAGGVIKESTLWACTTCMACVEACPVGIEHVPTIVQLRRRLVDDGRVEPLLQQTLQNFAQQGNSYGKSSRMRARWTKGLEFKVPDARKEPVEYLWFVGDFASFDERSQEASLRIARILHAAGVSFGLLYEGERNSGNDVRRVGEEGLFEMLVEQNMAAFAEASFERIFTTDPHSLNTLRNEYPDFGEMRPVQHYTELLAELLESGRMQVREPIGARVTYHDPCYLARYNRVTDAPRRLIAAAGAELVEMPRNGTDTFCCGAGGGRIWMDDSSLAERPSEQRIREARALGGLDYFVVSCPKDLAMYSDAARTVGAGFEVVEVTALLERALGAERPAAAEPEEAPA